MRVNECLPPMIGWFLLVDMDEDLCAFINTASGEVRYADYQALWL